VKAIGLAIVALLAVIAWQGTQHPEPAEVIVERQEPWPAVCYEPNPHGFYLSQCHN
jgi:ABC-type phosphate transport system auxiliary subunit